MNYTLLKRLADISIPNNMVLAVPWQAADNDDSKLWKAFTPTRITIPQVGVSKVLFSCGVVFETNQSGMRQCFIQKNGNSYPLGYISHTQYGGYGSGSSTSWTDRGAVMPVMPGDYFELCVYQTSGKKLNLRGSLGSVWLQCEVIA
jgi:hypothetical protein